MLRRPILMLILTGAALWGQVTQGSVTVTASRTPNLQPDQVVFGIGVTSSLDATRDDILRALQGSPISLANFAGVSSGQVYDDSTNQSRSVLVWQFSLSTALTDMKSTVSQLTSLQRSVVQKSSGLSLSFNVQGTTVSAQMLQSQPCSTSDLIADARIQAQKLAAAAQLNLGAILAVSAITPPSCSLTVKFASWPF